MTTNDATPREAISDEEYKDTMSRIDSLIAIIDTLLEAEAKRLYEQAQEQFGYGVEWGSLPDTAQDYYRERARNSTGAKDE